MALPLDETILAKFGERIGYKCAGTVAEALKMAKDTIGPNPSSTYMHIPPLFMCGVS